MNRAGLVFFATCIACAPCGLASASLVTPRTSSTETQSSTQDEHVFVELSAAREKYFVGESIHVRIRFGVDAEFARTNLVQLFQKPLDVPVQIEAPWIEGFANANARHSIANPSSLERRASFALAERPAFARRLEDRVVAGRPFAVLEYETTLAASASGALTIPATELRYAYATRFDEDFAKGRVALDRRDESVLSAPLVLTVAALPEKDRPADFGGAVGVFTITAELPSPDVDMGGSLALRVHIEGEGNLATFDAPRADRLAGFHVRGVLDDKGAPRRTITYDLTPNDERVDTVPPLDFTYFDPTEPARYKTIATKALPIRVRASTAVHADETTSANAATAPTAREKSDTAQRAPDRDARSPTSAPIAESRRSRSLFFLGVGLAALALFAGFWVVRNLRRRKAARTDAGRAMSTLRARLRESESDVTAVDVADAFAEYIATSLGSSAAAVIAPDLDARLRAAHVAPELATRTARTLEKLVAARYGGPRVENAASEIEKLALELEKQFDRSH